MDRSKTFSALYSVPSFVNIGDLHIEVQALLTSPRRASKHNNIVLSNKSLDDIETIASMEYYFLFDSVDFCIVFGALHRFGIFLNGKDLFPSSRARKGDSVATHTCESIDYNGLLFRCSFCDVNSNLAARR